MKMKAQVWIKEADGRQIGQIDTFMPIDYNWQINGLGEKFILVEVPEGLSINQNHLSANFVAAQAEKWIKEGEEDKSEQPMTQEYWSKEGEEDSLVQPMTPAVWINKNDASSVTEEPEDLENWDYYPASPNETWTYHESVVDDSYEYVAAVEEHWEIVDNPVPRRNDILNQLRGLRQPLLAEADYEVNKLEDNAQDASAMRAYRQALRDVTDAYIKVDGDPKVSVDSLDVENFEWPVKP